MSKYCYGTISDLGSDFFDNCILIGGEGGKHFLFEKVDEGAFLKEIKAWVTEDVLHGIEITLTDDSNRKFGRAEEIYLRDTKKGEFLFRNHEMITSLIIETEEKCKPEEGKGSLRGLSIKTNEGRSWSVGPKHEKKKVLKYEYPVASGICCGVFGYEDDKMLYQLGFAMLKPVKEAVLTDFRIIEEKNNIKRVPEIIESFTYTNTSSANQQAKFKTTTAITTTKKYEYTWTLGRALEATVRVGSRNKLQIETTVKQSESTTTKKENTTANTEMKEFEWPVVVHPKKKVTATARIYRCQLDTEYEADIEVRLMDGKVVKYKEKGTFQEVTKRDGFIETEEESIE